MSPISSVIARLTALTIVAGFAGAASANEFHYRNLLVGTRASGMGGAQIAAGGDLSSLFYSPAAAVDSDEGASGTINALSRSHTKFENFFPDGGSLTDRSSGLVPSYFGVLRHYRGQTLGFSIVVSDFVQERQSDQGTGAVNAAVATSYISGDVSTRVYQGGPTVAFALNDTTSTGLTLYGVYRDHVDSRALAASAMRDNPDGTTDLFNAVGTYRANSRSYGLRPVLGLRKLAGDVMLAATAAYELDLDRRYRFRSHTLVEIDRFDPATGTRTQQNREAVDVAGRSGKEQRRPFQFSLGASTRLARWLLTSFAVDYYSTVKKDATEGVPGAPPVTREFKAVTNFSLGVEAVITPKLILRAGAFTDAANVDFVDVQAYERREEIDLVGGSLGASITIGQQMIDVGAYYSAGSGEGTLGELGLIDISGGGIRDAEQRNLVVFLGTNF